MRETLAHFRYYGIPLHAAMPRVFIAIRVQLSKMLDLTDGRNRQRLRISEKRLVECDWRREMERGQVALTQRIGHAADGGGFEGLIAPSGVDENGRNIVIFPGNLQESSVLALLNPKNMPPKLGEW